MKVIGFEGSERGAPLTFGTAAFEIDGAIVNAITKSRCSRVHWSDCVEECHATAVPNYALDVADPAAFVERTSCQLLRIASDCVDYGVRMALATVEHAWEIDGECYWLCESLDLIAAVTPSVARALRMVGGKRSEKAARILEVSLVGAPR